MTTQEIFSKLWEQYQDKNPAVADIHQLFIDEGEVVMNDHIAFRTYDDPRMNIDVLSKVFLDAGYEYVQDYHFEVKHLYAKHFEHKTDKDAPRVFISELLLKNFSPKLQAIVKEIINSIPPAKLNDPGLVWSGRLWGKPSFKVYEELRKESEYAAWLYVYGFCANHFTVSINKLRKYPNIQDVNNFLKAKGYKMNDSGGEIKGTQEELLEQSSIKSAIIEVDFIEGKKMIPGCYYEFAKRYPDTNGKLYSGFIAKSADKIFESTDFYKG